MGCDFVCSHQFPVTEEKLRLEKTSVLTWAELVLDYDHLFGLMDLKRPHHCDKSMTGGS